MVVVIMHEWVVHIKINVYMYSVFFSKTKFIPLTALVIFVIVFIQASNLRAEDITALGISTMRGTFLTWDRYMQPQLLLVVNCNYNINKNRCSLMPIEYPRDCTCAGSKALIKLICFQEVRPLTAWPSIVMSLALRFLAGSQGP